MEFNLQEYKEALASSDPTPGGGTASAVALGHACSLAEMVCKLTIGKEKWMKGWDAAQRADIISKRISLRTNKLATMDSDSFEQVMHGFRLPKSNDEEKELRRAAIRAATLYAAEVPFETATLGMELLRTLEDLARHGNANAASDIGVASLLASAAVKGALFNVEINVQSLPHEMGDEMAVMIPKIRLDCSQVSRRVMHAVHDRIAGD